MMIKAIETAYKGYRFRSRLEARWAVFFDTLELTWEYEKEGFHLGKIGRYLPDFWLPELDIWIEIKPDEPDGKAIWKARELADIGKPVCIVAGTPGNEHLHLFAHDITDASSGTFEDTADWHITADKVFVCAHNARKDRVLCDSEWDVLLRCFVAGNPPLGLLPASHARRARAYTAARSARFEHGERGLS